MREILFRGKRVQDGQWVFGSYVKMDDDMNECFRSRPTKEIHKIIQYEAGDWNLGGWAFYDIVPETVGQYIWLKDKNNTKAFVGDIFIDAKGIKRTIMQNSGGFVTESHPTAFGYNTFPYEALSDEQNASWFSGTCEIISNIHDNPELINK